MKTLNELLAPIKERIAKATPGPWKQILPRQTQSYRKGLPLWTKVISQGESEKLLLCAELRFSVDSRPDSEFIAHSRADIERLVRAVECLSEAHELIHMRIEGFEEDLYKCPEMAYEALESARKILEEE